MRFWQNCWNFLLDYSQDNPPRFVELIMLSLGLGLIVVWFIAGQWPYLILSLGYGMGASASLLVRETRFPTRRVPRLTALLLFLICLTTLIYTSRFW